MLFERWQPQDLVTSGSLHSQQDRRCHVDGAAAICLEAASSQGKSLLVLLGLQCAPAEL